MFTSRFEQGGGVLCARGAARHDQVDPVPGLT